MRDWRLLAFVGVFIALASITTFVCYKGDCSDKIEFQQARIAELELKVRELRRVNNSILVLEQVLTPRQICELEARNEALRQRKIQEYKRRE